jgi:alpha-glucosidase (family GH31 glycosyl hydrolase)
MVMGSSQRASRSPKRTWSLVVFLWFAVQAGAATNPIVAGNARFTVVTPLCIRLEYSANSRFVDEPSLFAAERQTRSNEFKVSRNGHEVDIDTGAIMLRYRSDGNPFSPKNLTVDIHTGSVETQWAPGKLNKGNLGGTITTLDGADGPEDLGEGLISRDGWYLLDDSRSPLLTKGWVKSRPADSGSDWYLFGYGHDYKASLKTLAALSGPVPMPRKYALGAWYSRYWPYSSADYRQIVAEYQQHDFPLDNIVLDMDWHKDGWTGWSWNRKLLPDAEKLLPWFHSQGLHDTLNLHPADGVAPYEDQYAHFMRDMGADPSSGKTIPFDAGNEKYMDTLFKDVLDPLHKDGVDFWWLDWQQYPFTRSVPDLTNLFWLNTLLYDYTAKNGQRGMSFSRWGGWGDQRHPIHFSGDASTSFSMLSFEVPFTSTAGNVGCFFWSHDIGGHTRGRNEESYARWVQFGATSAALRSHSTRDATMDRRPWLYPQWATDSMRVSFHLRDELFPYIYTSAHQSALETEPLNRPLYIDYPNEEKAYHEAQEYLYGDDVLVAPITSPGVGPRRVAHQTVWFPPAKNVQQRWFNYFTGEEFGAGTDHLVSGEIDEFPIYFKGGVPIPMRKYSPRMATAPLDTLVIRAYPGVDGQTNSFSLYEDDGETTAYRQGASASTKLTYAKEGMKSTVKVGPAQGSYKEQLTNRNLEIELPCTGRATSVMVNGRKSTSVYAAETQTNTVSLENVDIRHGATIIVTAGPGNPDLLKLSALKRRISGVLGSFSVAGGAALNQIVSSALDQAKDPASKNEVLAAAGVGLVAHNTAPYLYHGDYEDLFYTEPGLVSGAVTAQGGVMNLIGDQGPTKVFGGVAPIIFREKSIEPPASVVFTVGSRQISQSSSRPGVDWRIVNPDNVASSAKVSASGSEDGYSPEGAVDGVVDGYPGDMDHEWSSGAKTGAWLQLDWTSPQTVSRVDLYDRPNLVDQITSGTLTFSDGSSVLVGPLPNDAKAAESIRFPAKTITWVRFTVTGVKPGTQNSGLSELAVFR